MSKDTEVTSSLYRRCIGKDFDCMPPILRRFHDLPNGGTAQGMLRVTRGAGLVRKGLAALMQLPRAGEQVPIHLEVRVEGKGETWIRHFDGKPLTTRQWLHDDVLIEAAGPMRFGFRMSANTTGMRFQFARAWFGPLPLPLGLSPRVWANVQGRDSGWWVEVQVEVPLFGMLARYEGELTP